MTTLTRRALLAGLAAAPLAGAARAQADWPNRPVRVMVPYPPAGGADTTARIVYTPRSSEHLRPAIRRREPRRRRRHHRRRSRRQGRRPTATRCCTTPRRSRSTARFIPICRSTTARISIRCSWSALVPNILVVTPSVPVKTWPTSSPTPKARPTASTWRRPATARCSICASKCSAPHRPQDQSRALSRRRRWRSPTWWRGRCKFFFANGSSAVGLIKGGKVKAIAHTGKGRLASLPDIPPMSETLPGFEAYEWNGVFVPHGTPQADRAKLNAGLNAALVSPKVSARFKPSSTSNRSRTRRRNSANIVEGQMTLWSRVVKEANIKLG